MNKKELSDKINDYISNKSDFRRLDSYDLNVDKVQVNLNFFINEDYNCRGLSTVEKLAKLNIIPIKIIRNIDLLEKDCIIVTHSRDDFRLRFIEAAYKINDLPYHTTDLNFRDLIVNLLTTTSSYIKHLTSTLIDSELGSPMNIDVYSVKSGSRIVSHHNIINFSIKEKLRNYFRRMECEKTGEEFNFNDFTEEDLTFIDNYIITATEEGVLDSNYYIFDSNTTFNPVYTQNVDTKIRINKLLKAVGSKKRLKSTLEIKNK